MSQIVIDTDQICSREISEISAGATGQKRSEKRQKAVRG